MRTSSTWSEASMRKNLKNYSWPHDKDLMIFFVTFWTREGCLLPSNLFNIILNVWASTVKQTKGKHNGKKWNFLYFFKGHDCELEKKNPKEFTNKMKKILLEIIN
jgi:hypothetical protein